MKFKWIRLIVGSIAALALVGGAIAGTAVAVDHINQQPSNDKPQSTPPQPQPEGDKDPITPAISGVTIKLNNSQYTEGETITASAEVTPSGLTGVTYQWSILGSSTPINNKTSSSISFDANKDDNGKKLMVVATYNGKQVKDEVSLVINSKPTPTPGPDSGTTITSVTIHSDYTEYYAGDEIRIISAIAFDSGVDTSAFTYEWHKILGGRDEIVADQIQYEFVTEADEADNGMQIYVNVSYKGNTLKSNVMQFTIHPDDSIDPTPPPAPAPNPQPVPPSPEAGNFDAVDKAPAPDLPVPSGYKDWKGKLPKVDRTLISSNAISDKEKLLTWEKMEMEMVYHARFVLYQSFENNLSQVTYYSKALGPNQWEAIAEGIIAESVTNGNAPLQYLGTARPHPYSANKGDKVKVRFVATNNSWTARFTNGYWSFANKVNQIDLNGRQEYLFQFPSTNIDVSINRKNVANVSGPTPRVYSFVIGRKKPD